MVNRNCIGGFDPSSSDFGESGPPPPRPDRSGLSALRKGRLAPGNVSRRLHHPSRPSGAPDGRPLSFKRRCSEKQEGAKDVLRSSPKASVGGPSHTASEDRIVYYTYVLESIKRPGTSYIGRTSNLCRRLEHHTAGENRSTAKHRSWRVVLYIAFETRIQACRFERYLNSGSGHAFAKRHFWNPEF